MPCAFRSRHDSEKCQFDVSEEQLIQRGGVKEKWCIFHLPARGTVGDETDKSRWPEDKVNEFEDLVLDRISEAEKQGREADFTGVIFPQGFSFGGAVLPGIKFHEAEFLGDTIFAGTEFTDMASFQEVRFAGSASFEAAQFKGAAVFCESVFGSVTDFEGASFADVANFDEVRFGWNTSFEGANFNGNTFFRKTKFQFVIFRSAAFLGIVNFSDAGFAQNCLFGATRFEKQVDFSCTPDTSCDLNFVEFEEAVFLNEASFVNRRFLNTTNFRGCSFAKAPKFHNCLLHQDTDFEESKFNDISESAVRAYRTLKLAMENVRAHREEAMFYALEQKSLRKNKRIGALVRFFSWLYEKTSNYGQSIARPILTIALVIFLFAGIYGYITSPYIHLAAPVDWKVIRDALLFSVEQLVSPFHVWKQEDLPVWLSQNSTFVKVLATVESLLGLSAFALLLLSVRWRFKRG